MNRLTKRSANDIIDHDHTQQRNAKIARLNHMDVTAAATSDKCYLATEAIPTELRKNILSYCTTTCLCNLSETCKILNTHINQDKLDILTANYNPENPLNPFNQEVLPNFKTGNLEKSISLYLYSLNHLKDSKCLCYKSIFNACFNNYTDLLLSEFTVQGLGDYYKFSCNKYGILLMLQKNEIYLNILCRIIKKYLERIKNNKTGSESSSVNTKHILLILRFHKSHSAFSSLIMDTIFMEYQKLIIENGMLPDLSLLNLFVNNGLIDFAIAKKLKDYIIEKLKEGPLMRKIYFDFIKLLENLIINQVTLSNDDIGFLRNYVIEGLKDSSFDMSLACIELWLLKILSGKQELKLDDDDIEFLKNGIITNLKNHSRHLYYDHCLVLLKWLINGYELKLSNDDIGFLKDLVIRKLMDSSCGNIHKQMLVVLLNLMEKHPLRLTYDSVQSLKNYAITKLQKSECDRSYQELLLIGLSYITENTELFSLVPVTFFENAESLEGSEIRKQILVKFYERFLTHPDQNIIKVAVNICLLIDDIILDDTDLITQV